MTSPEEPVDTGAWPAWGVDALTAPPPTFLHGADAVSLQTDGRFFLEGK
jgi:hypothetical protein